MSPSALAFNQQGHKEEKPVVGETINTLLFGRSLAGGNRSERERQETGT